MISGWSQLMWARSHGMWVEAGSLVAVNVGRNRRCSQAQPFMISSRYSYAALRKFGNVTAAREKTHRMWGWDVTEQCAQDFRYAFTGLRRNPLFAFSAVAMLTLGITAVTAVFGIVDAVLLRPSSFLNPNSVAHIEQWHNDQGWSSIPPSIYALVRERHDLFPEVIAQRRGMLTITQVPVPDQMFGEVLTGNLFSLLAAKPLYGRTLERSDDSSSAPPVMLLSYYAWQHLFASDPQVVGRIAEVDGRATAIIGVMPENFVMPGRPAELWLPLRLTAADFDDEHAPWVETLARLTPGFTLKAAQSVLDTMAAALNRQHPSKHEKVRLRALVWQAEDNPNTKIILWLALGTVVGLLAIGCANVSSLLLARGLSRRRDYAIRIATGASYGRLMRQSFVEVLLLSLIGLALGLICSASIVHFLRESLDAAALGIPDIAHAKIDFRVVVFSFLVSLSAALLSAGLPAWITASLDLSEGLRESGTQTATGHRVRRLMFGLMGVQAGICMALLLISGLLITSLMRLKNDDHGIRADRVLTMRLPFGSWFPAPRTPEEKLKQTRRYLNLLDRVRSVDGVVSAALSSSLPLSNVNVSTHLRTPSETARADSPLMLVRTMAVTTDYFRVMGIPLAVGQLFRPSDGPGQPKVVMINQAFADRYFHGANPVGRFLRGEKEGDTEEIIGVTRNTAQLDLNKPAEPELFISFDQMLLTPFLTGLVVRTASAPEGVAPALRAVISQEDPLQPVVKVRTLRSLINENIALSQSSAWIVSLFATVALVLSSAGIYGVVSFATLARQRDFGIRLCLGATRGGIFRIATLQALVPVCIGVLAGVGAASFFGRVISAVLYKAKMFDIVPAVGSVLVLLTIAFAAAAIPALRSARTDPARTLRND
jgi:predicted permease